MASLRRLKSWLSKATEIITALSREMGFIEREPNLELGARWSTWPAFTHAFSRTLYPKRFPLMSFHTILTG